MINEFEKELHIKVDAFKIWAKINHPEITEDNDNGEWCFCDEFKKCMYMLLMLYRNVLFQMRPTR